MCAMKLESTTLPAILPWYTEPENVCPRRILNVVIAASALLLTLPLLLAIALAIKSTSKGPIIYKQYRIGFDRRRRAPSGIHNRQRGNNYGGRIFTIYKFRTMSVRNVTREDWAKPDDPRITRIGAILRRHHLDELPQLFNVLKGDMNIVGPRPEQPEIFQHIKTEVPDYPKRQRVLPGVTGWAQINLYADQCIEDVKRKVALDLEYIQRCSATEDFKIMVWTIPVLVLNKLRGEV